MARSCIVDPLEKFRFAVSWTSGSGSEGTSLVRLGFHDVQMPKRTTNKISYREGIDPDISQKSAGLSDMEDVVMSRGVIIEDAENEFYKWMSAVHNPTTGHEARVTLAARKSDAAANEYKKDVTIQLLDREGNVARQWTLFQAFPIQFTPASDLNSAEDGEKAMEALTLTYEDFQEEIPGTQTAKGVSSSLG